VIGVSGDGAQDHGASTPTPRDNALAGGVEAGGRCFCQDDVVGGSGAFPLVASSFENDAPATENKLVREIKVPEAASLALFGFGLAALGFARHCRGERAAA